VPLSASETAFGLVEAAGVEPASEAVSYRISTSVSRILVLARRLLLTGSAFCQPRWVSRFRAVAPPKRQSGLIWCRSPVRRI